MTAEAALTAAEARTAGLVPLTSSDKPAATVETVAGPVRWSAWCRGEANRVRAAGRKAEIVKGSDGWLAVWVSPSPYLRPETKNG